MFRDAFEFADAAREVMGKFGELRQHQEGAAKQLFGEARDAFQKGDRDGGWKKYEELVARCWASSWYARVKRWLADKK